ncbi:MAG: Gldg family protein [Pseudobacter sp.]|uniref:Gldg family protein n=1 Tax=Pseudobacter sp. TaxID=2045420 RepID=UPI003F7F220F
MKIIFKIARAELRTLFYSPIAWLVLILFFTAGSGIFAFVMEKFAVVQDVSIEANPSWNGFESGIGTIVSTGILSVLKLYLYLFIPLLTMGVISREVNNGTIRLLYSSPINTREIVIGKYLGLMLYNCILLSVIAIQLLSVSLSVKHPEINVNFSILLGIFLMMATYSAIGLFISCLTNYQIVAAVITFAVLFVLENVSSLWQQYDLIRDITFALSISGKTDLMLGGLITSREVLYFLSLILLFVGAAMIKLRSTQESKRWTVPASRYSLLALLVITIGYVSSRPRYIAYADTTRDKINTLHPVIREVLKELDGSPLTVTLYTNLFDGRGRHGLPQNRNKYMKDLWEPFIRFYPNIRFEYEYYYDVREGDSSLLRSFPGKSLEEIAEIQAEILGIRSSLFMGPEEIRKKIDLSAEDKILVMQLEYNGKKTFLRTFSSPLWPPPNVVAASINRLTRNKEERVSFVTGHYERSPVNHTEREFMFHTNLKKTKRSLINNGVDTDTISLATGEVPKNIDLLVVADPKSAYSPTEQQALINYLDKGGNALIFTEPGKQHILAPVLKEIGVYPDDGIIVRPNKNEMPHIFINGLNRAGNFLAKEPQMEMYQIHGTGGGRVHNEGMLNLSYREINGFRAEPVITKRGDANTWIETGVMKVDSAPPVYTTADGDVQKAEYVIALKLTRKINNKEQRIIVAGDADFMSEYRMRRISIDLAFYSWTLYNKYPYYANFPVPEDRFLKLTPASAALLFKIYVYLVPSLLLLTAIVLLVRRKRK